LPWLPVAPVAPTSPVLPALPVEPAFPVLPWAPWTPGGPAGPGTAAGALTLHAFSPSDNASSAVCITYFMIISPDINASLQIAISRLSQRRGQLRPKEPDQNSAIEMMLGPERRVRLYRIDQQ